MEWQICKQKKIVKCPILRPFLPKFEQRNFFFKNLALSVLEVYDEKLYLHEKNQKKLINGS